MHNRGKHVICGDINNNNLLILYVYGNILTIGSSTGRFETLKSEFRVEDANRFTGDLLIPNNYDNVEKLK